MNPFETIETSFISESDRWLGYDKQGNSGWLGYIPSEETEEDLDWQRLSNLVDEMQQEQSKEKLKKEQPANPELPDL
jgi:hypothetical protein